MENVNKGLNRTEETRALFATVKELRVDCAKQQKKGLHFILTSVIIWAVIFAVQQLPVVGVMIFVEVIFCICLMVELRKLAGKE